MAKKKTIIFISLAAFLAGIMFMGGSLLVSDLAGNSAPGIDGGGGAVAERDLPGVDSGEIANIVSEAGPAVVKISTTKARQQTSPYFDDPLFRYFFGDEIPSQRQEETGIGSGFIISEDGLVITNQHVIADTSDIKVTVGENEYSAKVVGSDYDLDLAILKLQDANDLPHLKMGDSEDIKVGNWVIAIGNPFGFDHTVTVGVISAKGRPITVENRHYRNLLQTDAAINPGNSGGPLINLRGEVIGINTAVAQAQGIGFAIPTKTVDDVLDELLDEGKVSHPWLGVQMSDLTTEIAQYFNLENTDGVIVRGVISGSPAEKAGLRQGDIILELNDNKVKNAEEFAESLRNMKIGENGKLKVLRDGQLLDITFTVGEKPSQFS